MYTKHRYAYITEEIDIEFKCSFSQTIVKSHQRTNTIYILAYRINQALSRN